MAAVNTYDIATSFAYGDTLVGIQGGAVVQVPNSVLNVAGGKVTYVDSVNGSDSTGVRGSARWPFLTPLAAQTAASSGDCIVVLPGSYTTASVLGKNGVNWWLYPGCTITGSNEAGTFGNSVVPALTCKILGHGTITNNSSDLGTVVCDFGNGGPDVVIEAELITHTNSNAVCLVSGTSGTVKVRRTKLLMTTTGAAAVITSTGGVMHLQDCDIYSTDGNGINASAATGLIVQGGRIVAGSGYNSITGTTSAKIYGHVMANLAKAAGVTLLCGTLEVDTDVT